MPLAQSASFEHDCPSFAKHRPVALHVLVMATQESLSSPLVTIEQVPTKPVWLQLMHTAEGPHAVSQQTTSTQLPSRHALATVHPCPWLSLQLALPLPLPSHTLVPEQGAVALLSVVPFGVLEQVPTEPVTLQDWQVPRQPVLQQTPSMQLP